MTKSTRLPSDNDEPNKLERTFPKKQKSSGKQWLV